MSDEGDASYATNFWRRYFKCMELPCKEIKNVVKKTMDNTTNLVDPTDLAHLWLCLLFSCFLLPTAKMSLGGRLLKYIENLHITPNLNWADHVHRMIFENIQACHDCLIAHEQTEQAGPSIGLP